MNDTLVPIRRALLSVSDKRGLIELANVLIDAGVELLASGGTHAALTASGLKVKEVADYTGQPEILGGRVKTLHPKIHGGILARRDVSDDMVTLERQGIGPIDLIVVNLYPFQATIARPDASFEEAVENIDVGGPSLIRAAAKNHAHVAVVTDADQYGPLIASIRERGGTDLNERRAFALTAFAKCAAYDGGIADYFARTAQTATSAVAFPQTITLRFTLRQPLRYGENPHQGAAFYVDPTAQGPNVSTAAVVHGKELSYNNLLDLDSALRLIRQFSGPAACILKHNNPCGAAVADDLATAFERAYEGDSVSAFGGIVGLNRRVDRSTAERMGAAGRFIEAVLAPGFDDDAIDWLRSKPSWKNSVRLIDLGQPIGPGDPPPSGNDFRRIEGGLLVQSWDEIEPQPTLGTVVTGREPTEAERRDLDFAWRVCAGVKSNAIVLAKDGQLVGVGAGQMSRLDSVRIAANKAGPRARGSVMASDAFFPFRDGPDVAADAGVTAIIQPGGSRRDDQTIEACDQHGMSMILTGRRHFRH